MRRLSSYIVRLPKKVLYSDDRRRRYGPGPRLLSALRRWRILLSHRHAYVHFHGPAYLGPGFSLHIPSGGSFIVGPNVEFRRDFRAEVEDDGVVKIGAGTVFTYDVVLQCTRGIEIGEQCMVAHAATVVDGQHRFRDLSRPIGEQGYDWHPISIGNGAWINSACTIMANVGERAVVGANSVVTRDIPPFTVAVGAPARVAEEFGSAGSGQPSSDPAARD